MKSLKQKTQDFKEKTKQSTKKIKKNIQQRIKKDIEKVKNLRKQDVFIFLFILLTASIFIWFLKNFNPEKVVNYFGIGNIYLIIFVFAIFGGVSFLTATYFYATYIVFVLGGANPFLLALTVAFGLTIGDLFFYFVGLRGSSIVDWFFSQKQHKKKIDFIELKLKKHQFWYIYLYAGFLPFPKDILSFALGLFNHKLKNIILPLILGNFTYNLIIAYLVVFGFL